MLVGASGAYAVGAVAQTVAGALVVIMSRCHRSAPVGAIMLLAGAGGFGMVQWCARVSVHADSGGAMVRPRVGATGRAACRVTGTYARPTEAERGNRAARFTDASSPQRVRVVASQLQRFEP
jgi:hypothetical protein